ncbi:hypothetical protein [Psychromonas hadalis]|nr:hypothetical protein [Psychromonas hadalis]
MTIIITFYARKIIFIPISEISTAIDKLRKGERDIALTSFDRNDEL